MAKIAETYLALKFSKLVRETDDSDFVIEDDVNNVIAGAVEDILKEAGLSEIIVEVVKE